MSVGKMEMISSAAAKMTKSAAACELTGTEIWMLAKTAIELFGALVSRFANKFTSYSIDSSLIIDLTAKGDDGQFWDLGTKEDQKRLEQMQEEHQTELLIGSAQCMSFRTLLHPSEKGTKRQIEKVQGWAEMKNGWLVLWNAIAICEMSKTSWQMGKLLMKGDSENHLKAL